MLNSQYNQFRNSNRDKYENRDNRQYQLTRSNAEYSAAQLVYFNDFAFFVQFYFMNDRSIVNAYYDDLKNSEQQQKNKHEDKYEMNFHDAHENLMTNTSQNNKKDVDVNYVAIFYHFSTIKTAREFFCHRCDKFFLFNNLLHKHLRLDRCKKSRES